MRIAATILQAENRELIVDSRAYLYVTNDLNNSVDVDDLDTLSVHSFR